MRIDKIYMKVLLLEIRDLIKYAGLYLIAFIGIMGIGTIILNLLYSKLLGGMMKMLLEKITVESILGTREFRRAFL
jgi:hypothetical protein